ncbi:hypothetical protein GCM10023210_14220 [Chryseobacterium ginsengisoli]|uniref:Crp/Fnr family transcriptional regulator n=1 Tax=Chryseobacterium ginsengisoli TaxID=363853 RepID=A0ABP9M614_9FLAO
MIISEELLLNYGADYQEYEINSLIFSEGSQPCFYYQIVSGIVELTNYSEDGKEFTHNILTKGHSVGESLLFNDKVYPATAICKSKCTVLKLKKTDFINLLIHNPELSLSMFKWLSDRLYYKYIMLFSISSHNPSTKIKTLMDYLKDYNSNSKKFSFEVPLTRQQIANLTGLRVETVIRTIKKMEAEDVLRVKERKIYY